jgi:hypothetical protein
MLVAQPVCHSAFDGDVRLGKYYARIIRDGIFLRILAGIDMRRPLFVPCATFDVAGQMQTCPYVPHYRLCCRDIERVASCLVRHRRPAAAIHTPLKCKALRPRPGQR